MVNMAIVVGTVVKAPQARALPSGLSITSFDIRARRQDEAADTVPVSFFAAAGCDEDIAPWAEGEELLVVGRVRRRFFRAGGGTQSRTEVVADQVLRVADKEALANGLMRASNQLSLALDALTCPLVTSNGPEG